MRTLAIPGPYLLFLADVRDRMDAKTAVGVFEWRPERCLGQLRLDRQTTDLGLEDMTPSQAAAAGARTLLIGVAAFGGRLDAAWEPSIRAAIDAGLNVAAGLHDRLADHPEFASRAKAKGVRLFDVRGLPPGQHIPVGSGRKRSGRRLLTVGTDCAVGKKFTALALERDMRARGLPATFRATGQTGILISGSGIAIDSVVADFVSGAVELLSPDAPADHWDVIEGQGSLFHPAYAAVSLGLLHGSQPDAFVVCHLVGPETIGGYPEFPLPTIEACIVQTVALGRLTNPAIRCVGVSMNTSALSPNEREATLDEAAQRLGLSCVDPSLTSTAPIIDALQRIS